MYMYVYMYMHMYMYMCMYIHVYTYIYIYSRTLLFIHSIYKSSHLLTQASHSISLCTLGNHQSVLHVLDSVSA